MRSVDDLRSAAIGWSLRPAATAADAVNAMRFVQYDPIRSPARAQDLILAQRVDGYRVGDLDRSFEQPGLEEDDLHVYGVMPGEVAALLRPRCDDAGRPMRYRTSALEKQVLALVREQGRVHPSEARALLGTQRTTNAWGGNSAATTKALEHLHHHGLLRVSHRRNGTKVYEPAPERTNDLSPEQRLRHCVLLLAQLLAPVPERSLREAVLQLRRNSRGVPRRPEVVADLLATGELTSTTVDGVIYLWPAAPAGPAPLAADGRVRFLAPFDPVVWDRRRFEHLWGWPYRFEAYTPPAKRRFGYYALPLLWRDQIVGWVNATATKGGSLTVDAGYVAGRPREKAFGPAFDDEVARLRALLDARGS